MRKRPSLALVMWSAGHAFDAVLDGHLGLPNFQRRFEWTTTDTKAFLSTVLAGLPSGTLMVAENDSLRLLLRPLDGGPPLQPEQVSAVVLLDGQQRLTALFQSVFDVGPDRYAVDFTALAEGSDVMQDDVIVSVSARQWSSRLEESARDGKVLVPVSALYSSQTFISWLSQYRRSNAGKKLLPSEELGRIFSEDIRPIERYEFPVTRLEGDLDLATVAQVFERTNRWGQRLDAFDLLVARLQGSGWGLRDAWQEALQESPAIKKVFGDNGLSSVAALSLVMRSDIRRSAVLSLPPEMVARAWPDILYATEEVAQFLLFHGVRRSDLLPYDAIGTTLIAAVMSDVPRRLLSRYFWNASAKRWYESASNTKVVSDFKWLTSGRLDPSLASPRLSVDSIEKNTRRESRALWSTILCVLLSENPLDLVTGAQLSNPDPEHEERWDLFPLAKGGQEYESENDIPARLRTAGQLISLRGRSMSQVRLRGLVRTIRDRYDSPQLFGSDVDACLASQLLPPSEWILDAPSPRQLIHERSRRIHQALLVRLDEEEVSHGR